MRKNWSVTVSAVALTWASAAAADTTISTAVTTPVTTATANSGAPDNVVITSAGSVKPTGGAAVTLNSSNTVSNAGTISFQDVSGSTGILVQGGFSGSVTNSGSITNDEAASPADSDNDGDLDGPVATGANRYGIRILGPGTFTGAVTNSGVISIEGNDSAGLSAETSVAGTILNSGTITVTGSRVHGLRTTGAVTGDVKSLGTISVTGEGAKGMSVEGAVSGGVVVQNTLASSGYRYLTRPTAAQIAKLEPDDLLQSGSALTISNNVGRGLLLDAPPPDRDSTKADEDNDGITDSAEGTATVTTYGAAPAIVVGASATAQDVRLGVVGTGEYAYGIVNRGAVRGLGVYDRISATGIQLGLAGGGKVVVDGGLRNAGTIGAGAVLANATGLLVEGVTEVPTILNSGEIFASVSSEEAHAASAVSIRAGAKVTTLHNSGVIQATMLGEKGDATAIRDLSGTLTDIRNTGSILATINPNDDENDKDDADILPGNEVVTGKAIALDLSANTTGVRLVQVKDGSNAPAISGAILFGSGSDRVDVMGGAIAGDMSFGAGANILAISGGATIATRLSSVGGTLHLEMEEGLLALQNSDTVTLSNLILGAKSQLIFTVDPTTGTATRLDVNGAATIASGAKLGIRLSGLQNGTQTYTVIRANQLTAGTIDSTLLGSIPYLYRSSINANTSAGTVQISVTRKTATELQLASSIAGALEPILTAAAKDDQLEAALIGVTDRAGFVSIYEQLLPNRSGGVFQWATAASDAFARATTDRTLPRGGLFLQEIAFGMVREREGEQRGYKAWGLGLTGGYETPATSLGSFGVTLSGASGEITDRGAGSKEKTVATSFESGAYWRVTTGGFSATAGATGGYLNVDSDRAIAVTLGDNLLEREASADWQGWSVNARAAADYKVSIGESFFVRPSASVSYHRLREGKYEEKGGGVGVDLAVDKRSSSQLSAFAGVGIGAFFGENGIGWGPELTLGYRTVASEKLGATRARFLSGGDSFTLRSEELGDSGPVARLSFKGDLESGGFAFQVGADRRSGIDNYDFRLAAHLVF